MAQSTNLPEDLERLRQLKRDVSPEQPPRTGTSTTFTSFAHSMSFLGEVGDLRMQATFSQAGVPSRYNQHKQALAFARSASATDTPIEGSMSSPDAVSRHSSAPGVLTPHSDKYDKYTFMEMTHQNSISEKIPLAQEVSDLSNAPNLQVDESVQLEMQTVVGLSMTQVVVYLVTAILGCGVVVLPSLMALGGWLVVPVLTGLTTLAFIEIARVMDLAIRKAEKKGEIDSTPLTLRNFEDLGRAAMDRTGVWLIRAVTGTGFFGTLIVYSILIGNNISSIFCSWLSVKQGILCAAPALLVLAVLPDSVIAKIMVFGMFASLSSCVLICVKGYLDAHFWQSWPEQELAHLHSTWPEEPASMGTVLAVLFSAFSVMGTVPCIRGQMHDTQQFLPAFRRAMAIVFCMYVAVMLLGYWGYGNYVQHNVVDSMMFPPATPHQARMSDRKDLGSDRRQGRPFGIVMAVLVTIYLFLSFSLFFKCTAGMLQNLLSSVCSFESSDTSHYAIRVMLVIVVVLVAEAVPHFRTLMAIMSSVCCSCNNVFFPLLFAFKLEDREFRVSVYRRMVHICILVLALLCFCLGLFNSVSNLVKEMKT